MTRHAVAATLLAASLAACADPAGPGTLQSNRAKWEAAGPASYTYRLQRTCFCILEDVQPVRITVQSGAVTAVTSATTGDALPPDEAALFQITIDSLFNWVETAAGGAADAVTAEYDATLGYPRMVSIDYVKNAVDDEIAFSALLLTP